MIKKINLKILCWTIIIYFFTFERVLVNIWEGFGYFDELLAIYTILLMILNITFKRERLKKEEILLLILWGAVLIIGIVSNFRSALLKNKISIIIDILSTVKVWLAYYAIIDMNKSLEFCDFLIIKLARIARILVLYMVICLFLSQFIDIGMSAGVRYGLNSFTFWFKEPGNFSKLFYFIIPLLSADLYYKNTMYKKTIIALALVTWVSSLRSRAIAFAMVYILLAISYFFFKKIKVNDQKDEKNKKKNKIKIKYIIPIICFSIFLCWNQIIFYFTTSTQARSVLLRYGIKTMQDYFPLGSGFGTFGSDVAATNYSKLYIKYGFNSYYGMRENETSFLNDNYWPMILGQFGIFGTILVLTILYKFMKMILNETRQNVYFYFSTFCALVFLLLSSVASKSYSEYSSICIFLLLGLLVKRERNNSNERKIE